MSLDFFKRLFDTLRDLFALLYTPVMTALACWLTWSFMYGPWSLTSETLRLTALGFVLGGYVVLQGLGGLWLQRRSVSRLKVEGPGGTSAEFNTGSDAPPPQVTATADMAEVKP